MHKFKSMLAAISLCSPLLAAPFAAQAADPQSCDTVRLSNVGWTDIAVTTASTAAVLEALGYKTTTTLLAVSVTFKSMQDNKIDVFLGNWMPSGVDVIAPYLKDGSLSVVRVNLTGAKYTLAVPDYVYDAGVHSFADIAKHKKEFRGEIYGIQPGGGGNKLIQGLIDGNKFDLGTFKMVQSSEAGMLSQVDRATKRKDWIVFLGWEPHPMNTHYNMKYLEGGDDSFGPNYGGATVETIERKGYSASCPNVGKLLTNLEFSLPMENELMDKVLTDKKSPEVAAREWIKANPQVLDKWLAGVTTLDGKPGLDVAKAALTK
jgi:glycine betaine/proline transport system substrate-binding protein